MKNLLAFLAAAVIMFGGVGWYLDWFQIFNGPAAAGHHVFSVDLDAAKMQADVRKGEATVADAIEKARKDAAANKAAAGTAEPVVNSLPAPVKPIIGAGHQ
jgi:hypothetical protein